MSAYAIRAAMCIARGEPIPPLDGAPKRRSFEAINLALKAAALSAPRAAVAKLAPPQPRHRRRWRCL